MADLVVAEFADGFIFKSLLEILHQCFESGNFSFNSETITFNELSQDRDVLVSLVIFKENLLQYSPPVSMSSLRVGLHIKPFRAITKTIVKKDKLLLRITPNEVILRPSTKLSDSYAKILEHLPNTVQDLPSFLVHESQPTVTISTADFCRTCLDHSKSSHTEWQLFTNGMNLLGITDTIVDRSTSFGNAMTEQDIPIAIPVHSMTMKALAKLTHLAQTGVVKIYHEESQPVKLLVPIGHIGELRIYLFPPPQ